jgi:CheY-like chemotaxis protein
MRSSSLEPLTVLVADDNEVLRREVRRQLEGAGST